MEVDDNWKGIKMEKITRRKFMESAALIVITPAIVIGKSEQGRLSEADLQKISQDVKAAVMGKVLKKLKTTEFPDSLSIPSPKKLQKVFGKGSMILDSKSRDDVISDGEWHHFFYNKVGDVEEMYLDGKKMTSVSIDMDCEILQYRREQCGVVVEEEFWFRNRIDA